MATGYILSIGYLSGYSYQGNQDEAWQQLRAAAQSIALQPERIAEEARKFNAPEWCCEMHCSHLMNYCEIYASKAVTNPLMIIDNLQHVFISASGDRTLKEHVARAFCRLVIYDMHRQGIEVQLEVG